jgi:peroxidase
MLVSNKFTTEKVEFTINLKDITMPSDTDKNAAEPIIPGTRSYNGSNNNTAHPEWGQADHPLFRNTEATYVNGSGYPRDYKEEGKAHLNPRRISNIICKSQNHPSTSSLSSYMWAWGQFVDHEITLTHLSDEKDPIITPVDDPDFPNAEIPFRRSEIMDGTGTSTAKPREQKNALSAYIDAANVYGVHKKRADSLRRMDGTGKLKSTGSDNAAYLPKNTGSLDNEQGPVYNQASKAGFFVAGDVRVNEHNVLTCMHTLFMREHNRLCDELINTPGSKYKQETDTDKRDETIYQRARKIVGALEQAITYEEFLPALLGPEAILPYNGYKEIAQSDIASLFSAAAYRLGHDMLTDTLLLVEPGKAKTTSVSLHSVFFEPHLVEERGVDVYLRGLAQQRMENINGQITDSIRIHLFNVDQQSPPAGMPKRMMDLGAINIMRGRDHGLPDYNTCREAYGLPRQQSFKDITTDPETLSRLKRAYKNVNEIDPWIGGLVEDHYNDAQIGEFFYTVILDQFNRLRNGDRFWYQFDFEFTTEEVAELQNTTLSDVIKRNTDIENIQSNVFHADLITPSQDWVSCSSGMPNDATVNAIVADPSKPGTLYSATSKGIFKSSDKGKSWTESYTGTSGTVNSFNTLTYHYQFPLFAATNSELFHSIDDGESWSSIYQAPKGREILALMVDPNSPSTLYQGTNQGVFKSTTSGVTWTAVNNGLGASPCHALEMAISRDQNESIIYAATDGGVFKSTDEGQNWQPTLIQYPIEALALDPKDLSKLNAGGLHTSDGGKTWNPGQLAGPLRKVTALAIDPKNPTTVYAGTLNGVYKKQAGLDWLQVGQPRKHIAALALDPHDSAVLYASINAGGLFKTNGM